MRCPKFTVWHPADLNREESGDKESIIKRHIYSGARLVQIWALVSWTISLSIIIFRQWTLRSRDTHIQIKLALGISSLIIEMNIYHS